MDDWPHIVETLEDDKDVSPEDEFFTNATEHIQNRNFRLAVLDAVIGLEIVLAQFLRAYLSVIQKLPNRRISKFLDASLGLSDRLSVILALTLHESWLKDVELDKVMTTVGWRNIITHKTGRLPEDVPKDKLREGIDTVLNLAKMLAERRDDIKATPAKEKIMEALKSRWDCFLRIWIKPWHSIQMRSEFWHPFPARPEIESFINSAIALFGERDARFDSERHLTIYFYEMSDKPRGVFSNGTLILTPEKPA